MKHTDFLVKPGSKVSLKDLDPSATDGYKNDAQLEEKLNAKLDHIAKLQERLYAEGEKALLLILQGMDTSGKDGATKSVLREVNPQGVTVTSFKVPSKEELAHDFLWRVEQKMPPKGQIGVFNRSHYEDVLVVRVHSFVPKEVWAARYDQINAFEKRLAESYVRIVKIFLHISKDEQKERLTERLVDPTKHWKFNPADLKERALWKEYREAYDDALAKCCTKWAPWYIVPSNKKWFRNLAVAEIVEEALSDMDPKFPKPSFDPTLIRID